MPTSHLTFKQKSWRLSPMYLFYFTLFGTFVPYIARFLTTNGLSEKEASVVVAVINGVNVFAPFLFSYLADKSGRRMGFIRFGYLAIGAFYLLSLFGSGFWFYLAVFGMFGVFLSAVLPQMETVTLAVLDTEKKRYGQVRLWGSLGFVVIVWALGFLLDAYSVAIIPMIGVGLSVLMFLSTFLIPERPRKKRHEKTIVEPASVAPDFTVNWWQVIVLLFVILFWQFGMAPYNTFFDLYLREQGSSATVNGFLISFGALCEIGIFFYVARLFNHFSERFLMAAALLLTAIRWTLLYWFADIFTVVLLSQTFHAATFGIVHSVAVHRIGHLFPESKASFGQGLYVAFGTGVGLFIGNILAGQFYDGTGMVYLQATGWTLLAFVVAVIGFRDAPEQGNH